MVLHAPKLKAVASALAAAPHRNCTSHRSPTYPSRQTQRLSMQQPAWQVLADWEISSKSPPLQVSLPPESGGSKGTSTTTFKGR